MQSKSLSVPVEAGRLDSKTDCPAAEFVREQFVELLWSGGLFLGAGVEIVSLRVQAKGVLDKPRVNKVVSANAARANLPSSRPVYLGGAYGLVTADVARGHRPCAPETGCRARW
jgi:N-methylhydantoinase A